MTEPDAAADTGTQTVPLRLQFAAISDVGRVRKDNQDSGYAGPWLLTVCDGVGGAARGDIASSTAVQQLRKLDERPSEDMLGQVAGALHRAHDRIAELVDEDPSLNGTSTTATVALFGGSRLGIGHVGDSRAYLLRDGEPVGYALRVPFRVEAGAEVRDLRRRHGGPRRRCAGGDNHRLGREAELAHRDARAGLAAPGRARNEILIPVAVDVCSDDMHHAVAYRETLTKTSLGALAEGSRVNLERAVTPATTRRGPTSAVRTRRSYQIANSVITTR